jgi:hypothetical protein
VEENPASPAGSQKTSTFLKEEKEMFQRRLFLSLVLIAIPASADVLQVAVSGVFENVTVTTPLDAQNAPFKITFDIDSQPTPTESAPSYFGANASNLEYDLNHSAVLGASLLGPALLQDASDSGELSLAIFGGGSEIDLGFITPDQLYSGTTSNPEILTGTLVTSSTAAEVSGPGGDSTANPGEDSIVITDLPTPEPGADLLLGTGLTGAALLLRRRRRFAAPREGSQS